MTKLGFGLRRAFARTAVSWSSIAGSRARLTACRDFGAVRSSAIAVTALSLASSVHATDPALVFVSRQIPDDGTIYWNVPEDLPGVGPHSRFRVAAPGRLMVRESDGSLRTLVDGAHPTAASLSLVDVNAPDVSYDGTTIAFAGLSAGAYDLSPVNNPNAWRIYTIRADGSELHEVTHTPPALDMAQFGAAASGLVTADDTDPCWLPDGRLCFSSTRYPSFAQYSGVRTTNLFVVDPDGAHLHRITTERNGADRPLVDPSTGKIVYSRWWRNHRFAVDSLATIPAPSGGFVQKDGLSADRNVEVGGPDFLWRNAWHAATINPDGTGLAKWSGFFANDEASHLYGGAFSSDGKLFANYFPMYNMTEAAGFGGIRLFTRGAEHYTPIAGITSLTLQYEHATNPTSYGVFHPPYFAEPCVLPDGSLVVSRASDVGQDYGLYRMTSSGGGVSLLLDFPGTSELRAKVLASRSTPNVIPDRVTQVANPLPPASNVDVDTGGTFTFDALNVYANGPVDADMGSAPPIGSAARIVFFADTQRTSPGSFPNIDWPIPLGEKRVSSRGAIKETHAPADVPLFEQLRSKDGLVPLTADQGGAAHVAGMNFGRPGSTVRCLGCHAGHTLIPVPETRAEAAFSNLAPGASIVVSSTRDASLNATLVDRRVMKGENWRTWTSQSGATQNQWAKLAFAVPISVRGVRLYDVVSGGAANSSLHVLAARVTLYAGESAGSQVAVRDVGPISVNGTLVDFPDILARSVRVDILTTTGTFYGMHVAGLSEIEVIARGENP